MLGPHPRPIASSLPTPRHGASRLTTAHTTAHHGSPRCITAHHASSRRITPPPADRYLNFDTIPNYTEKAHTISLSPDIIAAAKKLGTA